MNKTTKFLFAAAFTSLFFSCQKTSILETATISGKIACPNDQTQGLADVKIEVWQNAALIQTVTTNSKGEYLISNLDASNEYTLNLNKDDVYEGTTFDLVLISKAILETPTTTNPFKFLAKDADLSGNLNNDDVLSLRGVILGTNPNVKIWRFATTDFELPTLSNPSGKGSVNTLLVNDLLVGNNVIDFVPVKLGDTELKSTCK